MRKVIFLALVMLLALVPVIGAQGDPAISAVDWIETQQAEDGSFAAGDPNITAAAATSLALLDRPNEAAVAYLENYVAENADSLRLEVVSAIILAVIAHDIDPTAFADGAALELHSSLLREQRGEDSTGLCLGLVALAATGAELPATAVSGVVGIQNEDGGFGSGAGEPSEPIYTAVCIHALAKAGEAEATQAAVAYLDSTQLADGGWATLGGETSDGFGTAYVLVGLAAAEEDLMGSWGDAVGYLMSQQDRETGEVTALAPEVAGDQAAALNVAANALFTMAFRGLSYNDIGATTVSIAEPTATEEAAEATTLEEGPALDGNWLAIADGFGMTELDTADDFFVTVIDPFTNEELYGVQIINWVAEYQYTGYIIEQYLPADVLLYMQATDPTTFENLGDAAIALLPADVLAELPEEVQARAQ